MSLNYLRTALVFLLLRVISVVTHFVGASPWGGPMALRPSRFLPEALLIELVLWTSFTYFWWGASRLAPARTRPAIFLGYLVTAALLSLFSLIDFEVVRWLGQHMSLSYIQNFAGARDGKLFARILSSDLAYSGWAALEMLSALVVAAVCWRRLRADDRKLPRLHTLTALPAVLALSALPFLLRPSEKRWRRVRPATIGLIADGLRSAFDLDRPQNPTRALQDLTHWVATGSIDKSASPQNQQYPLLRDDNVGDLELATFKQQPLARRPDIVLVVFETLRGMNSGVLSPAPGPFDAMPRLRARFEKEARYFPRVHSAGYPSVEGALGMHLGIWPHYEKIVFSSYLHVPLWSFPEILRQAGYRSQAVLGADPSFSNFTPWFRRWYDTLEFDPARHHDGPLVDRLIQLHEQKESEVTPQLYTLWTATTHPPYDVPLETGVIPADTNEARYLQAMRYADEQIDRLVEYLKASPRWDRTLVFVLGDHSQPTPWQWRHTDSIGELNPGHTWTALGILGGGPFAPRPERVETAISHVNLAPTILAAVNLKHKNHFFGDQVYDRIREQEVLSFRYGTVAVEQQARRDIFRIRGGEPLAYSFDPNDLKSYGALVGGWREATHSSPQLSRYRDMALLWAQLLEEQRVAPNFLP